MSESTLAAPVGARPATAVALRAGSAFYLGMSGALLLIVLMGFSRTLYLRAFFDVASIPPSVLLHGLGLTAWFVGSFLQAALVAIGRTDVHRRLGWVMGALGVAVLASSLAVTLNFVPRRLALGADIEAGMAGLSSLVWSDLSAVAAFAILLPTAVALRRRPETHKRLMLLSSISLIQPALSRMSRWAVFGGTNATVASLSGVLLLLLLVALYDVVSRKRVHASTVLGGSFLMGSRIVATFVIATSEIGRSLVRGLG